MPSFIDYHLYPWPLLFTYHTGYDVYNSIAIKWHTASTGYPGYIRDQVSIKGFMVSKMLIHLLTYLLQWG